MHKNGGVFNQTCSRLTKADARTQERHAKKLLVGCKTRKSSSSSHLGNGDHAQGVEEGAHNHPGLTQTHGKQRQTPPE